MKRKTITIAMTGILKTNSTKKYLISPLSTLFSFWLLPQIIMKGHELGSNLIAGDIIIIIKTKTKNKTTDSLIVVESWRQKAE